MPSNTTLLKYSLLAGALYFFSLSLVHMLALKVPMLFVFYDVPSHAYQDRIISFLAFGWAAFLFTAYRDPVKNSDLVAAILVAGAGAIASLIYIIATTDFQALDPQLRATPYWLETAGLFVYLACVGGFWFRARARS